MNNFILFIARLLLTHMFLLSGAQKIMQYSGVAAYMVSKGVPEYLLIPVIALELIGALCIILGFWSSLAAYALAGFCILSALIFHSDFTVQSEVISFMKNFTIAGGLLVLAVYGPGGWRIRGRSKNVFS